MAGMYGLGYGAGAMGAGLGQGMVQGQMLAPQLQAMGLQNQQRQMSLDEQKAMQQEYALAPQVLADPSLKIPGTNQIDPAQLMARLPHTGANYLNAATGANLKQANINYLTQGRTPLAQSQATLTDVKANGMAQQQSAAADKQIADYLMVKGNDLLGASAEERAQQFPQLSQEFAKKFPGALNPFDAVDPNDTKAIQFMKDGNITEGQAYLGQQQQLKFQNQLKLAQTNHAFMASQDPAAVKYLNFRAKTLMDETLGLDYHVALRQAIAEKGSTQPGNEASINERVKTAQSELNRLEDQIDPKKKYDPSDPKYPLASRYHTLQKRLSDYDDSGQFPGTSVAPAPGVPRPAAPATPAAAPAPKIAVGTKTSKADGDYVLGKQFISVKDGQVVGVK